MQFFSPLSLMMYGSANDEPQRQNITKLPEELEGKTVKKAETVKDVIDSE
jgi:hypothetical protein